MPKPLLLLVITACSSQSDAEKIAATLVRESLAACVNIIAGVQSFYRWEGRLQQGNELILMIKCQSEHYSALEQRLHEIHPYEVPEIIALPVERGLPAYLSWASECTAKHSL